MRSFTKIRVNLYYRGTPPCIHKYPLVSIGRKASKRETLVGIRTRHVVILQYPPERPALLEHITVCTVRHNAVNAQTDRLTQRRIDGPIMAHAIKPSI